MSIVALDIASKSATFCVLGTQGVKSQGSLTFDHDGFSSFIASTQVSDASLFVMESTGGYHLPLYHFLLNHGRKAMFATMNKLVRTLHALLTKDEMYSL